MAAPTITYGHKFLSDLAALTEVWEGTSETWTESAGIDLISIVGADITGTILHGDILQIQLDCNDASTVEAGFYCYPDKGGANNLNFSTTTYPSFLCRYKTSASDAGAHAKVVLAFAGYDNAKSVDTNISDGNAQLILDNAYSTTWTTETGTITTAKTLDHILLFAECDTDTSNGTYYVYYDFVLIHEGTFTLPHVSPGGIHYEIPYKTARLQTPGRDGDIEQRIGMGSPKIRLEGSMEHGETWGGSRLTYGEYLMKLIRGKKGDYPEPWQWLTSDLVNCKVVPDDPAFRLSATSGSKVQRMWTLRLKQYSLSSLSEADWDNLEWLGI